MAMPAASPQASATRLSSFMWPFAGDTDDDAGAPGDGAGADDLSRRHDRRRFAAAVVAGAAVLSGCALRAGPPPAAPERIVAAYSVRGHAVDVVRCGRGPGGVVVLGGVHGDERGSALLVRMLAESLRCPADAIVTIVPGLNPDGLEVATRSNARGVDLNRNMPAWSWTPDASHGDEPLSEPESRALDDMLRQVRPVLIVSVHEADVPLVDWDGPASEPAAAIAACIGLPLQRIGPRPGSLGSLVGIDWGWPLVTIELPRATSQWPAETVWERYGSCLRDAIEDRW